MKKQLKKWLFVAIAFISCSIVSTAQGTWTQKTNFTGTQRWGAVAFTIGTKAYLGTGFDGSFRKDFMVYDQSTGLWDTMAAFPGAGRSQAIAFSIGNKGYVGTGCAGLNFPYTPHYADFWEYDPATNHWTARASFPGTARFGAVAFSIGNKGYLGTGFDAFTYFQKDFWEYDPANDHWTQRTDFAGTARMEAVGFSIGNKGYIGTGGNYMAGIIVFKDFWEYDTTTYLWTQRTDFGGVGRSTAAGFSIGNKGYIGMGGNFNTATYSDFWEFDQSNNAWTPKGNFGGTSRWLSIGFSIGNMGYFSTGATSSFTPTFKDLWEYNPIATGIAEANNQAGISIYPQPAYEFLNFLSDQKENLQIEIYSSLGVKVMSKKIQSGEEIMINTLSSGLYYAKIISGERKITIQKIQIVH